MYARDLTSRQVRPMQSEIELEESEPGYDIEGEQENSLETSLFLEECTTYVVQGKRGATVRALAALSSPILGVLPFETRVTVVERRQVHGRTRARLVPDGWVSAKLLKPDVTRPESRKLKHEHLALAKIELEARTREGAVGGLRCTIVAAARLPTVVIVLAQGADSGTTGLVQAAWKLITDHGLSDAAIFVPNAPHGAWWDPMSDNVEAINAAARVRELTHGGWPAPLAADLEPRAERRAVDRAVAKFHDVVQAAVDLTGAQHVFIGGQDQGATLAFETCKSYKHSLHGLLLLSPLSLFAPKNYFEHKNIPILLTHANTKIPVLVTRAARCALLAAGATSLEYCDQTDDLDYSTLSKIVQVVRRASRDSYYEDNSEAQLNIDLQRARAYRNLSFKEFKNRQDLSAIPPHARDN